MMSETCLQEGPIVAVWISEQVWIFPFTNARTTTNPCGQEGPTQELYLSLVSWLRSGHQRQVDGSHYGLHEDSALCLTLAVIRTQAIFVFSGNMFHSQIPSAKEISAPGLCKQQCLKEVLLLKSSLWKKVMSSVVTRFASTETFGKETSVD